MGKNSKRKEVSDAVDAHIDSSKKHSDKKPKEKNKKKDDPPQSSVPDTTDIDDLFGQLINKKKKQQQQEEEEHKKKGEDNKGTKDSDKDAPPPGNQFKGSKDDLFGTGDSKSRKRTEEGYIVYTEDELQFSKKGGGGTALCPFDCDCCF